MKYVLAVFAFLIGFLAAKANFGQSILYVWGGKVAENAETTAVAVTGILAFVGAVWGVFSQRAITRRQVTLEFLAGAEADKDISGARAHFIELAKSPEGLAKFAAANMETNAGTKSIQKVMNHFELIAVGIERGIIDYEIYKLWYSTTVVQHWAYSVPFVMALRARTANKLIYREFETMAGWFSGKEPPRRGYRLGQWF